MVDDNFCKTICLESDIANVAAVDTVRTMNE